MSKTWSNMTAADLGRAIAKGTINPVELTEFFLDKIDTHPLAPRIYARTTATRARGEAMGAASRAKLKSQADKGSVGAASAMKVTEDRERMIGALLLGNNVVNILSASLATALLTRVMGDGGVAMATMVMTALVLIFGEVMPKTVAQVPTSIP